MKTSGYLHITQSDKHPPPPKKKKKEENIGFLRMRQSDQHIQKEEENFRISTHKAWYIELIKE